MLNLFLHIASEVLYIPLDPVWMVILKLHSEERGGRCICSGSSAI